MVARDSTSLDNRLLAALTPQDLTLLRGHFEPVSLSLGEVLIAPGKPIEHAYFVEEGMISLVQPLRDGATIEVGVIGSEGFVGTTLLLGSATTLTEAMVQLAGAAQRIPSPVLLEAAAASASLRDHLLRFTQALHTQVTQTAACNGRHTVKQRLARWLLTARDRTDHDQLPLRHEFLSMMLGNRRAGVTAAAGALAEEGLIDRGHGLITILDRRGLEAAACECYRTVRREYKRLLG